MKGLVQPTVRSIALFAVIIMLVTYLPIFSSADGPPTIVFSPDTLTIPKGVSYPVNVTVIDADGVASVTLHWRFSSSEMHSDPMAVIEKDLWHGELPAQDEYGVFSLYITAVDSIGNEVRYPRNGNMTVWVADMTPPSITMGNSTPLSFSLGHATNLTVQAEDDNSISYVAFYYRYEGDVSWQSEVMAQSSGNTYYIDFAPERAGPMEYYFSAFDGRNHAFYPSAGAADPIQVTVSSGGLFGLSFTLTLMILIAVVLAVVDAVVYVRRKRAGKLPGLPWKRKEKKED